MSVYRRLLCLFACVMALSVVVPVAAADAFTPLTIPASPPRYVLANFPVHAQWWGLSCEYAATSAATQYFGRTISEQVFRDAIGFDPNPNKAFRGNIYGGWGGTWDYGIYPAPILRVLMAQGFKTSYDFRADPSMIRDAISHNRPVVVWINGTWGYAPRYYAESDGESYLLVPYEHAITLYGYDENGVYIMDPGMGSFYYASWGSFMNTWMQLDGMALAVGV
jgi:uncharacterized protein YvpB